MHKVAWVSILCVWAKEIFWTCRKKKKDFNLNKYSPYRLWSMCWFIQQDVICHVFLSIPLYVCMYLSTPFLFGLMGRQMECPNLQYKNSGERGTRAWMGTRFNCSEKRHVHKWDGSLNYNTGGGWNLSWLLWATTSYEYTYVQLKYNVYTIGRPYYLLLASYRVLLIHAQGQFPLDVFSNLPVIHITNVCRSAEKKNMEIVWLHLFGFSQKVYPFLNN